MFAIFVGGHDRGPESHRQPLFAVEGPGYGARHQRDDRPLCWGVAGRRRQSTLWRCLMRKKRTAETAVHVCWFGGRERDRTVDLLNAIRNRGSDRCFSEAWRGDSNCRKIWFLRHSPRWRARLISASFSQLWGDSASQGRKKAANPTVRDLNFQEEPEQGEIVEIPMVGGLHHPYSRRAA